MDQTDVKEVTAANGWIRIIRAHLTDACSDWELGCSHPVSTNLRLFVMLFKQYLQGGLGGGCTQGVHRSKVASRTSFKCYFMPALTTLKIFFLNHLPAETILYTRQN